MRITSFLLALAFLGASCKKKEKAPDEENPGGGGQEQITWPTQPALPVVEGTSTFQVSAALSDTYIDVMGVTPPRMPNYPQIKLKPGRIRGFVADLSGKPLKGAFIQVRTGGNPYTYSQTYTDENGYYELAAVSGVFFHAGYAVTYGKDPSSKVALSLYPVDGEVQIPGSALSSGMIKNWVLLSYGPGSNDRAQGHPSRYLGGQLTFNWEEWYASNPQGIPAGKTIVIEITPVAGKTLFGEKKKFIVNKNQNGDGLFNICNIPLGVYEVSASIDGQPLRMKQTSLTAVQNPNHGLFPREITGKAEVYFIPTASSPETAPAKAGYLNQVMIELRKS